MDRSEKTNDETATGMISSQLQSSNSLKREDDQEEIKSTDVKIENSIEEEAKINPETNESMKPPPAKTVRQTDAEEIICEYFKSKEGKVYEIQDPPVTLGKNKSQSTIDVEKKRDKKWEQKEQEDRDSEEEKKDQTEEKNNENRKDMKNMKILRAIKRICYLLVKKGFVKRERNRIKNNNINGNLYRRLNQQWDCFEHMFQPIFEYENSINVTKCFLGFVLLADIKQNTFKETLNLRQCDIVNNVETSINWWLPQKLVNITFSGFCMSQGINIDDLQDIKDIKDKKSKKSKKNKNLTIGNKCKYKIYN